MKKKKYFICPSMFNYKDAIFWAFIFLCFVILIFCIFGCHPIEHLNEELGLEPDNVVEEVVEFVIQKQTGIQVDLSPSSPEQVLIQ